MAQWSPVSPISLMTTELNALAAGGTADQAADFDNNVSTARYMLGLLTLDIDYVTAPVANGEIAVYARYRIDGTNLSDAASLEAMFIGSFRVQNTTARQGLVMSAWPFTLSPVIQRMRLVNNTSQAFPATGTVLRLIPWRTENT